MRQPQHLCLPGLIVSEVALSSVGGKYLLGSFPSGICQVEWLALCHWWASRNIWSADTCFLINCTTLSTNLVKDLSCPALELIQDPNAHLDLLFTNWEVTVDPNKMFRRFVFSWGREVTSKWTSSSDRSISHRLMGEVEMAPRYTVLWLPASEIQMGTSPTGKEKSKKCWEIQWPHLSLLLNASFSFASGYLILFSATALLPEMVKQEGPGMF